MPYEDMINEAEGDEQTEERRQEAVEILLNDDFLEKKTELNPNEILKLSLIQTINREVKRELELDDSFKTIYDTFIEYFLKYKVSLNRKGLNEVVSTLKEAPSYVANYGLNEEEQIPKKSLFRRLFQ